MGVTRLKIIGVEVPGRFLSLSESKRYNPERDRLKITLYLQIVLTSHNLIELLARQRYSGLNINKICK